MGFIKSTINIDGSIHKIYQIGNNDASDNDTLLLIGGIPTDPMESMTWLANELHKLNDNFRIIILNMPFYENNFSIEVIDKYAESDGKDLLSNKTIDFSSQKIDPKFSHKYQGLKIN